MKQFVTLSLLLVSFIGFAQQEKKITLHPPTVTEVTIFFNGAGNSSMQVSMKDFVDAYKTFKTNYGSRLADSTSRRYKAAINWVRKQKSVNISLTGRSNGHLPTLAELVNKSIGADLLNRGLASVTVAGTTLSYINSRSLIPSTEAAYWTYTDPVGSEFFYGAIFGSWEAQVVEEAMGEVVLFDAHEAIVEEVDSTKVYNIVEEMAKPAGLSWEEYYVKLDGTIVVPKAAIEKDALGSVFIEAIVERDGSFSQIKVIRGRGYGQDEEAVRVIREGPKFSPAKQGGKVVRSRIVLPVKFRKK